MRKIAVIAALTLLMLVTLSLSPPVVASEPITAPIQVFKVGDILRTGAYCANEVEAKKLAVVVALNGDDGYRRIMRGQGVDIGCFDARFQSDVPVLMVTLISKAFQIDMPDGQRFQFWVVHNAVGDEAYAWTYMGGGTVTVKQDGIEV